MSDNVKNLKVVPKDLLDIDTALCDTYYANFSVFQSLPDSWAIGYLFPVMPVHRLSEMPTRNAILADIRDQAVLAEIVRALEVGNTDAEGRLVLADALTSVLAIAALLAGVGVILCGIGAIVTAPMYACIIAVAYRAHVPAGGGTAPMKAPPLA